MNMKLLSKHSGQTTGLRIGPKDASRRRGAVAVQVAIMMSVLAGFAALSVDLGAIYSAKADLQRCADSAATGAASLLAEYGESQDPLALARQEATRLVTANTVHSKTMQLDPSTDIIFGRANYDADANTYSFTPTEIIPDAVKIRVRLTSDSPNGALPLFFAGIFGRNTADVEAEAIAMMVPRDIALVADLSGSHRFDSQLDRYKNTTINLHEVWDKFPGGIDDSPADWSGLGYDADDPQAAGGAWGFMRFMGWGTETINASYNPTADTGMIRLSTGSWNDGTLNSYLSSFAGFGYSSSELSTINSSGGGSYKYRVAVALGLARWDSGKNNGLWDQLGVPLSSVGNGDSTIESSEVVWLETIGDRSLSSSKSIFYDYIDNYMTKTWTRLYRANDDFKYRYGAKTFLSYLQERRQKYSNTPELAEAPQQPMQAVKDASNHLGATITALDTDDQLSLEIYGTTARHEVDLTDNYAAVTGRLNEMMASHYDGWTNMGGGIERAIEELTSVRARTSAKKVIFLLTDGVANVTESGTTGDYSGGQAYALAAAQDAADQGIRIFAVSVGSGADTTIMEQIAAIGSGQHFYASGSIEEYSDQLDLIFKQLGGTRPVELIK